MASYSKTAPMSVGGGGNQAPYGLDPVKSGSGGGEKEALKGEDLDVEAGIVTTKGTKLLLGTEEKPDQQSNADLNAIKMGLGIVAGFFAGKFIGRIMSHDGKNDSKPTMIFYIIIKVILFLGILILGGYVINEIKKAAKMPIILRWGFYLFIFGGVLGMFGLLLDNFY